MLIRERTNFSLIQNESENDKCFLPASPYPDAYGARPGHPNPHWCRDGWPGLIPGTSPGTAMTMCEMSP
jgi:hypothetical protein